MRKEAEEICHIKQNNSEENYCILNKTLNNDIHQLLTYCNIAKGHNGKYKQDNINKGHMFRITFNEYISIIPMKRIALNEFKGVTTMNNIK